MSYWKTYLVDETFKGRITFRHAGLTLEDLFGDAYEFLISNYAANAGKSGGEFFTPQCVSKLIAKLATHLKSQYI